MPARLPHPIPYQGSKRRLAAEVLGVVSERTFDTLYEPFAGSAAITIAAASRELAGRYVIGDSLVPLAGLWERMIDSPERTSEAYRAVWEDGDYNRTRAEFNAGRDPVKLLYLLARCVKNAPRFSAAGDFNQSADRRRKGMAPDRMAREIAGVSRLLRGRASVFGGDAVACLAAAGRDDLVYMDPPWQGTTEGADKRYHQGLERSRVESVLAELNERGVPWMLSYDGRSGERTYGEPLPDELFGARLELNAGRSSQATLSGRRDLTVESLYVSRIVARAII